MNGNSRGLFGMPPVVKNLIFINILMLLAYYVAGSTLNIDLNRALGMYFPKSDQFKPIQILTHMFLHGGVMHLFFNMFALYMFGQILGLGSEKVLYILYGYRAWCNINI
jgi:membrane associated rhomboid family serine protease